MIKGYQIGYRVKGQGGYNEQYTDLPMRRVQLDVPINAKADAKLYLADTTRYQAARLNGAL